MDQKQRLEIALKFCSMDLDTLRPGDELNLQADLRSFFGIVTREHTLGELWDSGEKLLVGVGELFFSESRLGLIGIPASKSGSTTKRELKRIQAEANSYLGMLIDTRAKRVSVDFVKEWMRKQGKEIKQTDVGKPSKNDFGILLYQNVGQLKGASVKISLRLIPWNDGCVLLVSGPVRDIFLTILSLLARSAGVNIRRCLECKKIFWGDPRKLYCSRPCVNKAAVRNWRTKSKEKRSEINHEKYVERLAKQTGNPNLKVQSRPRIQSNKKGGESK